MGKYFAADPVVNVLGYEGLKNRIIYKFSEEEKHLIHLYGELLSEENIA